MEATELNILFLNAYYEPEQISFTHLERDLLSRLVEQGHRIHIVCPTPTRGISKETAKRYAKIKEETLYNGMVSVRRFRAPQEKRNPIVRALRYFWCNWRTCRIGKKYKDIDVVFAVSTPPTQGYVAGKVAKKLKCPLVYSLQDIFPDSLVTTGLTSEGSLLWKIGRKIEKKTYKRCDKIIVISNSCKQNLLNKGEDEGKIALIPNWVNVEKVRPVSKEQNALYQELGIDLGKFTVVYAGNLGEAQGADVIIRTAERLQAETNVQFVIFGSGVQYEEARRTIEEKGLNNIIIHPILPQERVSEVYSLGDVALIVCKKGVGTSGMPSKTWSIMACNTPIISAFDEDSDLANLLKETGGGVCVEPENASALAEAIIQAKTNRENGALTSNARSYVEENASSKVCAQRYIDVLEEATKK